MKQNTRPDNITCTFSVFPPPLVKATVHRHHMLNNQHSSFELGCMAFTNQANLLNFNPFHQIEDANCVIRYIGEGTCYLDGWSGHGSHCLDMHDLFIDFTYIWF
ncbi:hypothetical protein Hanom_Chr09g00792451 [Helianthus anomalus]